MSHDPTPAERDERISLPLDPEVALKALMETGAHPSEKDDSEDKPERKSQTR